MPIEIRELIIKTEIINADQKYSPAIKEKDLVLLKKQLLQECKSLISESNKKNSYKR